MISTAVSEARHPISVPTSIDMESLICYDSISLECYIPAYDFTVGLSTSTPNSRARAMIARASFGQVIGTITEIGFGSAHMCCIGHWVFTPFVKSEHLIGQFFLLFIT